MSHVKISDPSLLKRKGRVIKNGHYYRNTTKDSSRTCLTQPKRLSPLRKDQNISPVKDRQIFDRELKSTIIKFLRGKKEPQKTLAIAKACNHSTSKEINPIIYHMAKQGWVEKCNASPPTWKMSFMNKDPPSPNQYSQRKGRGGYSKYKWKDSRSQDKTSVSMKITTTPQTSEKSNPESNTSYLFRDTLKDNSAPGAYIPKGAVVNPSITTQRNDENFHPGNETLISNLSSTKEAEDKTKSPATMAVEITAETSSHHEIDPTPVQEQEEWNNSESSNRDTYSCAAPVSNSSSDDDEEDDNEIQTRIRDMIFTNRVIEGMTDNYYNIDNYSDDNSYNDDSSEDDLPLNDVKDDDKNDIIEVWESSSLPDNADEIVNKILSFMISIPMGVTSKYAIMSNLKMSEEFINSYHSICVEWGFIRQTRSGHSQITELGKKHLSSKSLLSFTTEDSSISYNRINDSYNSSLSADTTGNSVPFVEKSHSSRRTASSSPRTANQSSLPPFGRGYVNSSLLSSSSSSSSSTKEQFASPTPAPPPDKLLRESCLYKIGNAGVVIGRGGVGRGQRIYNSINGVRPGQKVDERSKKQVLMPWANSNHTGQSASFADTQSKKFTTSTNVVTSVLSTVKKEEDSSSTRRADNSLQTSSCSSSSMYSTEQSSSTTLFPKSSTASSSSSPPSSLPSSSFQIVKMKNLNQRDNAILPTPQTNKYYDPIVEPSTAFSNSPSQHALMSSPSSERKPALLETPKIPMLNPTAPYYNSTLPTKIPLLPNPTEASLLSQKVLPCNSNLQINTESFAALNKNPISAFMEYAQSRKLTASFQILNEKSPAHKPVFLVVAYLDNRSFPTVSCHNKKDGRKEAAELAIRTLIAEGEYHAKEDVTVLKLPDSDMTHFDKMAALTHQKFNQLIAQIPESFTGRKVIAGLVVKTSSDDVGSVIAVGSGNRCITGDKLSLEGNTVNDCHAEIITRRGFLRFLYRQLSTYKKGMDHPLFEPSSSSNKLRVKDTVTFHLYISTAPCGDGALFSPRDEASNTGVLPESDGMHRPTFNTPVQGVLRTKMEGGEGTIPINPADTIQTWDGIVRGERLRTMSCSDKICRWNVLGLQGALLSHFVDTIYLTSLTLGFLYDHGHLSRAVCCRLNRGYTSFKNDLPSTYHLNHPSLGRVTACDPPRETQKTKSYSVNWSACEDKPELLDGSLGHCHTGIERTTFSRLSKSNLYSAFKSTSHRLGRHDLLRFSTYHEAKRMSKDFVVAKRMLMSQFERSRCGKWVSKPLEEEMFN